VAAASKPFIDQLLNAADEQRSADPVRYADLMQQLRLAAAEMDEQQRDFLNFLTAYQEAYKDSYQSAEIKFKALMVPNKPVLIRFRAALTLSNVQMIRRQFLEAFSNLSFAMALMPDIDDVKWRNQAYLSAASIYSEAELYQESLDSLQLLDTTVLSPRDQCINQYLNLKSKHALGVAQTIPEIEAISAQCADAGEIMISQASNTHAAWYYLTNQSPKLALDYLHARLPEVEKTGYNRLLIDVYHLIAQAHVALSDYPGALAAIAKLEAAAKSLQNSRPVVAGLKLKALALAQEGNFQAAYTTHQQYSDAERAMRDEHSNRQLAYQLAKGELLKKNQQLKLMKEELRVIELENQLKKQQAERDSLYIGLLSFASILLVYITYRLVRRHRFYKLAAENDGLTGISNRHFFDLQLQKQVKRCKQQQKSLGVIVFDLDFFKLINDNYGHDVGDKALQATVRICNHFIRSGDIFGRIGGEEFAIALPDCQPDKVLMLAEICRDAIEQLDCSEFQSGLKLTASFGVSYSQISGYQTTELMRHADQALYLAKYNGRNRVESYDQMQPHPGRPLINTPLR
jgi:diguanylate cyclase (GGDEF)-like protein